MKTQKCRFCEEVLDEKFADLGLSPLANSFLSKDNLSTSEPFYPLQALVCAKCFLVQLDEFEQPSEIFSNYAYFSSYSDSWLEHAKAYTKMITNKLRLNKDSHVVEIASNDGYLLQYFKEMQIPVLGIEPAVNVAKKSQEKGIPTITKFFGIQTANELVKEGKQADLLVGNNVLAHVPNLNDFVKGLKILLKSNGVITMEFPHLLKLVEFNQFDTIYHEHFSYFSLFTVEKIFAKHGLMIFDVEEIPTHGGSLRIYAKHNDSNTHTIKSSVKTLLDIENNRGLTEISTYRDFEKRTGLVRDNICKFLTNVKKSEKKIVGYGAPAKGNTLLNYCKIDVSLIEYTVDRSPYKQGLFLPGTHIPIKNIETIEKTKPDYLVILPWNLKDEIMEQMKHIRNWGGKFVVFIPEVMVYP